MLKNRRELEFNVDAYTARLIGRENVSKLEGAILEIVKNAYDADASAIYIYYLDTKKSLLILDNGVGMTEEIIRKHWMTIGNSSKKVNYVSSLSRIKTGAKGIGRFAFDRISDRCQMWTSTGKDTLDWTVRWSDFSDNRKISEVKAELYDSDETLLSFAQTDTWKNRAMALRISRPEEKFHEAGTVFRLTELHDEWTEAVQEKVKWHLRNLLPPDVVNDFKIYFFNDETDEADAEIQCDNVDQYDYKISFQVTPDTDEHDSAIQLQLLRNEFDLIGKVDLQEIGFSEEDRAYFSGKEIKLQIPLKTVVSQEDGKNLIGGFCGILYFSKVTSSEKDRVKFFYKDFTGRKNFTKEFGGIKLYRDHFRVRPYGEYGDNDFDWLQLSARRNKQPAALSHPSGRWRVGSDQIMGIVDISRENANLEDDANRNGLQDGPGFLQLKEILVAVIDEFERDRQYVGRKLADFDKEKKKQREELERISWLAEQKRQWEKEQGQVAQKQERDAAPALPPSMDPVDVQRIVQDLLEDKDDELENLHAELKMLRTLATTGIITNMFMHEIRTLTNNIGVELNSAYEALTLDDDPDYAIERIICAVNSKKHFNSWFGITIGAIKKDKRKRRICNVGEVLSEFMDAWKDILEKSNIKLDFWCAPDLRLRCFALDLENIFSNLISNSITSFEKESEAPLEEKKISVQITQQEDGQLRIEYSDTGWGLSGKYKEHPERTLEAFETDKKAINGFLDNDGTGMGMWIVNQIASDYQGKVDLEANKTLVHGYCAVVTLGGVNV